MRKLAMLLALAVAFSLSAFAQDSSAQTSGATGSTDTQTSTTTTKTTKTKKSKSADAGDSMGKAAAKESQLTGCLAKDPSGNGFMLTNGKYKKGVAVKSSEDLSAHVGHQVKLMGTWEKPSGDTKEATMKTFNATKLDHIADTCPAAGAAKGGKKAKSEATKAPGF